MENIKMFTGEPVYLYVRGMLSDYPGLAQDAKLDIIKGETDKLVLTLTSWCVAGRIPDNVAPEIVEYPDGTWQMFKDRHLPEWLKQRFPVRTIKVVVEKTRNHYFVCPHLNVPHRDKHIQFMATGTRIAQQMRPDGTL